MLEFGQVSRLYPLRSVEDNFVCEAGERLATYEIALDHEISNRVSATTNTIDDLGGLPHSYNQKDAGK